MLLINCLLFLLVTARFGYGYIKEYELCDLKSVVKCAENETDGNTLRLFLMSLSSNLKYIQGQNNNKLTTIKMNERIGTTDLDYHAGLERLYWTSPRIGFWTQNSRIYTMPWDYRFACENEDNLPWNIEAREKEREKPNVDEKKQETDQEDYEDFELEKKKRCKYRIKTYDQHREDDVKVLREKENWNPRSLAVDYVGDKLYVVDTVKRSVSVFNLDGENEATVFENETLIPMEVALDPSEGLMFVFAANIQTAQMQIYRANMDGTSSYLLTDNLMELGRFFDRSKLGFTIDTLKKKLYVANSQKEIIEQVDYKRDERLTVVKAKHLINVVIHDNLLYYSDSKYGGMEFMCKNGKCQTWTCALNETGICDEESINEFSGLSKLSKNAQALKVIDPQLQPQIPNPCRDDNGGCQHHCLLKAAEEGCQSLGFGCACIDGYRLTPDLKNCTRGKITYTYADAYVRSDMTFTQLWSKPEIDAVFPISRRLMHHLYFGLPDTIFYQAPFRYIHVSKSGMELVEQGLEPKDLSTLNPFQNYILKVHQPTYLENNSTRSGNKSLVLRRYVNESIVRAVAYDWITKNIYFVKSRFDGDKEGDLFVLRYDMPDRTVLKEYDHKDVTSASDAFLTKISRPISMVVHPYRGYVFVALQNGSIIRMNSDGSNKLYFPNVNDAVVLTVDLNDDKLYWLDSNDYSVNLANLDGSEAKWLLKTYSASNELIYVNGNWLYVKSEAHERIWRFDKLTGESAGFLNMDENQFYRESVGVKVSARDDQLVDMDHPCAVNNGGCEMFCFAVPEREMRLLKKVCRCGKSQKLLENGLNCSVILDGKINDKLETSL